MALTKKQNDLMTDWYEKTKRLETAKAEELEARNHLTRALYPDGAPAGLTKFSVANGYQLNFTQPINYTIDIAAMTPIIKTIREKFKVNAAEAIRTKYELKIGDYKKFSPDVKALFDEALTAKNGLPQLEIVKPKR